jgi:hypothetical protein
VFAVVVIDKIAPVKYLCFGEYHFVDGNDVALWKEWGN